MYAMERQREIVDQARREGRVGVLELAEEFAVAPETIRRDLAELERRGLLRRVHGGALPLERLGFEGSLLARRDQQVDQKRRIGQAALPIALEADSIFLDEGTTCSALVDLLHPTKPLTVVTASLPIATELSTRPHVTVLALGGRVRGQTTAVVDHWATTMLAGLVLDVAFIGSNGITTARGLSCPDMAVAAVKAQAIRSSRRSVLLADHTKFGADSFAVFAKVTDFSCVITDDAITKPVLECLQHRGVEVVRV